MKQKLISTVLSVAFLIVLCTAPAIAVESGSLDNFTQSKTYVQGQYTDVSSSNTFHANIKAAYEYGIMQGYGKSFGPKKSITRLAAIIIACRLNRIYTTGKDDVETAFGTTVQESCLAYAGDNGIYCSFPDVSRKATCSEFAGILSSALPDEALKEINTVEDDSIPNVSISDTFGTAVYRLYRAGVLIGSDTKGTFHPDDTITRGAACAVATRMAIPTLRRSVTLKVSSGQQVLDAETVYARCSPAVAYIKVYDASGNATASGSGFFLDSNGTFVTCFHVIDGCSSAKVTTKDGKEYSVTNAYDYNRANDWVVLKVDGSGFSSLRVGDASENAAGAAVYAIGSPLGLSDSISQGIISSVSRTYQGTNYIQTTASISSGSSGGALISKYGHVIGITCGSFVDGQNLNLAIPMTYLSGYQKSSLTPLSQISSTSQETTSSSGRRTGVFNYLHSLIQSEENTTVNGYPAVQYYNGSETWDLYYDTDEKCVTVYDEFDVNGAAAVTFLDVTDALAPYDVTYQFYTDVSDTVPVFQGLGSIRPSTFTANSTVKFSEYSGIKNDDDEKLCALLTASSLTYLDTLLSQTSGGYTIKDLGFTTLYSQLH